MLQQLILKSIAQGGLLNRNHRTASYNKDILWSVLLTMNHVGQCSNPGQDSQLMANAVGHPPIMAG